MCSLSAGGSTRPSRLGCLAQVSSCGVNLGETGNSRARMLSSKGILDFSPPPAFRQRDNRPWSGFHPSVVSSLNGQVQPNCGFRPGRRGGGDSEGVLRGGLSRPIAFLFIDGLHNYPNVSRDFYHFERCVLPGGLIAFHDYSDYYPGVKCFVDELAASGQYRKLGQARSMIVVEKAGAAQPCSLGSCGA